MAFQLPVSVSHSTAPVPFRPIYTGVIAFVAALGGLLFGYDWSSSVRQSLFTKSFFTYRLHQIPISLLDGPRVVRWSGACLDRPLPELSAIASAGARFC